jgi:hypothetical protein
MGIVDRSTKMLNQLTLDGMSPDRANRGVSFIQNMEIGQSSWKTRKGFGTVAAIDSLLTCGKQQSTSSLDVNPTGFEKLLGSYLIKETSFGHKQIVSIFRANAYTADYLDTRQELDEDWIRLNQYRSLYTVSVYDLTTNLTFEVPLYQHTSETPTPLQNTHAQFETTRGQQLSMDYQNWVDAGQNEIGTGREFQSNADEYFWFAEMGDRLFFGNKRSGAWVYNPADFIVNNKMLRQRRPQIQNCFTQDYKDGYGESSMVIPIAIRSGIFIPLTYLTQTEFGIPQAACTFNNRMVYAVDNVLYFSDPEDANAILAENVQPFPANIKGVAATQGNLIVWTQNATYFYLPALGDNLSGGQTVVISASVGILSPSAYVRVDNSITWIDETGVYVSNGPALKKLSEPIDIFFENGISNPLTSYYTTLTSEAEGNASQPTTFFEWNSESQIGATATYQPTMQQIIFTLPALNISLVLEKGAWHIWNYESIVATDNNEGSVKPVVKSNTSMPSPWLHGDTNDIYLVTDVKEVDAIDKTYIPDSLPPVLPTDISPTNYANTFNYYTIHKMGRGGALDASIYYNVEDKRQFTGEWFDDGNQIDEDTVPVRDRGFFFIDKPQRIKSGYRFAWEDTTVGASDRSVCWVPVYLTPEYEDITLSNYAFGNVNVKYWSLRFYFDRNHWEPVFNPNALNSYEVMFDLPPERLEASAAYYYQIADQTTAVGVRCVDSFSGLGAQTGNVIEINVDGTAIGSTWASAPRFGFIPRYRNPLLLLPFRRKRNFSAQYDNQDTDSLGIYPDYGSYVNSLDADKFVPVRVWNDQTQAMRTTQPLIFDEVQAVDWSFFSQEVDSASNMIDARGLSVNIEATGDATLDAESPASTGWTTRTFNAITSTNYKQYGAQLVDYTSNMEGSELVKKNVVRDRIGVSGSVGLATYNSTSTHTPRWGDLDDKTLGNFLIGDPQVDNIKTSTGVKGDSITTGLFGHILSPAEGLRLLKSELYARIVEGYRRRGRGQTSG